MGARLSQLVAQGIVTEPTGASPYATKVFESGERRCHRLMCDGCKHGQHSLCESEDCPCVCNDSDFRWQRKAAPPSETQQEMAQIIVVRPELRPLFNL